MLPSGARRCSRPLQPARLEICQMDFLQAHREIRRYRSQLTMGQTNSVISGHSIYVLTLTMPAVSPTLPHRQP